MSNIKRTRVYKGTVRRGNIDKRKLARHLRIVQRTCGLNENAKWASSSFSFSDTPQGITFWNDVMGDGWWRE